jgi:hypothetical protein
MSLDEQNLILAESVFRDVLRRRRAGEAIPDDQVLAEHPQLRELLVERLAKLRTVQSALSTTNTHDIT